MHRNVIVLAMTGAGCDFCEILPHELVAVILGHLPAGDLSRAACCSKLWRDVANIDSLWYSLCEDRNWLHYGCDRDLTESSYPDRSSPDSSKSRTSPSFDVGNLIEDQSTLNPTCRWKAIFMKATHLEKNWALGHYRAGPRLKGHRGKVTCIDSDGIIIASGSEDGSVRVWDIVSGQCLHVINGHTEAVTCLQLKDDSVITGSSDSIVTVFGFPALACRKILEGQEKGILQLKCDRGYLLSSAGDRTILVRSWPGCRRLHVLTGHVDDLEIFYLHDSYVMSTSWDTTCRVWDLRTGLYIQTLRGHTEVVFCCQFDDVRAMTGGGDALVKIWELSTGVCTQTLAGHTDDVYCLEYNVEVIASASADSTVRLWSHSGHCTRVMREHIGVVRCLRLTNGRLVSGGDRKKIVVWDGRTGDLLNVVHRNPNLLHLMWVSSTKIVTASPKSPGMITVLSYW